MHLKNLPALVNDPTAIDYESASGHSLNITVQAATTNGLLVSTHDFSIAITNANPSVPADSNATADSVTEGAAADTLVNVTAASTDVNGPPVTYSITSDDSNGGFKIDSSTGVVSVADDTLINYETAPGLGHTYSITVQASDGVGGMGAFFLLLDEPEVYGLPPDPVSTTRDVKSMWKTAAIAAAGLLGAALASFIGGGS